MTTTTLGPGAEFDAIRRMLSRWEDVAIGIGDDAAVVELPRGDRLVVSVDSMVENRHFRAEWLTPRELGYRAVTAALSDLAAMAARPIGILVALAIPQPWRGSLDDLADGIADAARVARTTIRGGNITAADELSITTTVLGAAFRPLTRDAARAGDIVYVTGALGGPAAAVARLARGESPDRFRVRFARPTARLREAMWLAERGARAAIDVSDGLVADLRHLAAASGVGITLDASRVPRVEGVSAEDALVAGEEYEIVVTAPPSLDTAGFERKFDLPLTEVGAVTATHPGDVCVVGARVAHAPGHDHFSS